MLDTLTSFISSVAAEIPTVRYSVFAVYCIQSRLLYLIYYVKNGKARISVLLPFVIDIFS